MLKDLLKSRPQTGPTEKTFRSSASQSLLQRVRLEKELEGHEGCVNTVSFTSEGEYLLSGSDDQQVCLWRWQTGKRLLSYSSGHTNNIFQAKALPHTDNNTIVTCAADGQVRVSYLKDGVCISSKRLARHMGRAHKLSLLPDQPQCFVSSGEDGQVLLFDMRAAAARRSSESGTAATGETHMATPPVARMRVLEIGQPHAYLEINAVHHNPVRPWLFAVGGADCVARVFDARIGLSPGTTGSTGGQVVQKPDPVVKLYPNHMNPTRCRHHITCVYYDCYGNLLATYNDEDLYLFSAEGAAAIAKSQPGSAKPLMSDADKDEARADRKRKATSDAAEGSSDGAAVATETQPAGSAQGGFNSESVELDSLPYGPSLPTQATSSDTAEPLEPSVRVAGTDVPKEAIRDRSDHVLQTYTGHRNRQTVKGCSFYGADDEYVVSGSDCGHVFIWDKSTAHLLRCMPGDRYVVNCLEPHPWQPLVMATSGIENSFKIWSPTAPDKLHVESPEKISEVKAANQARRSGPRRTFLRVSELSDAMVDFFDVGRSLPRRRPVAAEGNVREGAQGEDEEESQTLLFDRLHRAAATERTIGGPAATLLRILFGARAMEDDDDDDEEDEEEEGDSDGEGDENEDGAIIIEQSDDSEIPDWAIASNDSDSQQEDSDMAEEDEDAEHQQHETGD